MANSNLFDPSVLAPGSSLTTHDINFAVRRMKNHLALVDLKRRLLATDVQAVDALSLSSDILTLQNAA